MLSKQSEYNFFEYKSDDQAYDNGNNYRDSEVNAVFKKNEEQVGSCRDRGAVSKMKESTGSKYQPKSQANWND